MATIPFNLSSVSVTNPAQEADFFFSMVCAAPGEGAVTAAGGGGTASGAAGGRSGQQRYVVGVVPAAKLEDCAKEIENMVGA